MKVIIESTQQVIKVFSLFENGQSGKYALLAEQAADRAELAETGAEQAEIKAELSATLSQAWATGTEPGGVGTKSSREYSVDSATSADEAEAAKDAVDAITDFTEGNIYRGNGTGIEAINEKMSNIAAYSYGQSSPSSLFAADDFKQRGLRPLIDFTGKTYEDIVLHGNSVLCLDTSFLPAEPSSRNFLFYLKYETRVSSDLINFYLVNDQVNYIKIEFSSRYNIKIIEVVNDVPSIIFTSSNGSNEAPERFIFDTQVWWDNRDQRLYVFDDYRKGVYLGSTAIPTTGNMNKFGFFHQSVFGNARFINYRVELK